VVHYDPLTLYARDVIIADWTTPHPDHHTGEGGDPDDPDPATDRAA
jgi:hypothetical protein